MARAKFNHAYDLAFEVISFKEDASDVTPTKLRRALRKRLRDMSDNDLDEACGAPFDTFKVEG